MPGYFEFGPNSKFLSLTKVCLLGSNKYGACSFLNISPVKLTHNYKHLKKLYISTVNLKT